MSKYYALLNYVESYGACTRFYLENMAHGVYKDQIDECLKLGYIERYGNSWLGEERYVISAEGKRYLRERENYDKH